MEILKTDLKHGIITLKPVNMDDLWHIQQILEIGDKVTAKTERKTTIKRGQETVKGDRETMILGIEAEKISLESQLRLTGKIIDGPENITHEHHTLVIEPGTALTIEKQWENHQLERLRKAKIKKPLLFICVLDRDE
ncbi:MAG: pelota family protein, partial [Candidatus Aenigmarchaeota archaeon]|nr:pelota family protein [Candidatus Aenigmarchaeota archaeon]